MTHSSHLPSKPWNGRKRRAAVISRNYHWLDLVAEQDIPIATRELDGGRLAAAQVHKVLMVRAMLADSDGVTFAGRRYVAAKARLAQTDVQRADRALARAGLLVPCAGPPGTPKNVQAYRLPFLSERAVSPPSKDSEGDSQLASDAPSLTSSSRLQHGREGAPSAIASASATASASGAQLDSGRAASAAFAGAHCATGSTAPTTDPTGGQVERFAVTQAHGAVWITPTDGAWPGVMPVLRRLAELFSDDKPRLDDNELSLNIRPSSDIPLSEWPEYIEYLFASASRQAAELSDSWSRHKEAAQ